MNDLEHLVSTRLHALAEDIAPDADPYAQADGAQALHRRQRRTRAGLAGVAAGIAAVVIGVPLGIDALSSAPGADAAAPSASEEPAPPTSAEPSLPTGEAEPAPGSTDAEVTALAQRIAELYPDMSAVPVVTDPFCPATSAELERYGVGDRPTGSLIDGCVWTAGVRNSGGSMPLTGTLQLTSQPAFTDIGCPTAAIPGWSSDAWLRGCPMGQVPAWTLAIPADDGTTTWVITASGGVEDTPHSSADGPTSDGLLTALVGLVQTR
jgi:hypothetical protein